MNQKTRQEQDSIGKIKVSNSNFWGAQTQRSLKNFKIGNNLMPIEIIHALVTIKMACAKVNQKQKSLAPKIANAIISASKNILTGKHDDQFPLSVWQTGSGTQTNMNVNEVIANLANKKLTGKLGTNSPVHPNDHVNKSQSTNDSFPSAINIAASKKVTDELIPALNEMEKILGSQSKKWKSIIKIGRTHLQDATPLSLGQEFSGYQSQLEDCINRIKNAIKEIYFLAQGGTAVGTGINTKKNFDKKVCKEISKLTKISFKPSKNKFAALAAHDSIVNFSGTLNTTAVCLMKIANDIRFLGSGPRAGYGELTLPANEPGSSIMPGKVNPTQSEAVTMVCVKVIGNHTGTTIAGSQGQFELNVFKPLIAYNVLQSIDLISDSSKNFARYCVRGIKANKEKIKKDLDNSLMLVTALAPKIGYDKAANIAKKALKNNTTLKTEIIKSGLMNEKDFKKVVDPKKMIQPE